MLMKTIRKIAILCMVPVIFSCGQTDRTEPDPTPEKEPRVSETRTLTFVIPDYETAEGETLNPALKTAWVAGDQIVVHGEYAAEQVTVTLAASDISADGKSATKTVEGLYPYKREDCRSDLYASYPASASDNLKHCFFYSKFSSTNEQILAASNGGSSDNSFKFQSICGILSVEVDGDYDGFLLSTPKKDALGYEFLQVKITDGEQLFRQYSGDPVLQIEGALSDGKVQVFLPEGTSFTAGFTLKLKENGDYTKIYRSTAPLEISRGTFVDCGNVTAQLQHYDNPFSDDIKDLDEAGNANCYIVNEPGGYKFKAVKGNNAIAYFDDASDAEVLWETWNDVSEVTAGSVVASASYAEDYVIIHTPATLTPGNAVVALKDSDGKILWSWHIWVPKTRIETASYGGVMGNDIMDRNLGALVAAETGVTIDPLAYGFLYQWGRKDPFTASGVAMANTLATCAGAQDEVAAGQITLEESIANPRLLGHINNGDWLVAADNELWSDTDKTVYDPCPAGYRVPPMNTSVPFWSGISTQAGWSVDSANGYLTIGSPTTVLPLAGYRDDYDVGGIAKVGARTLFWTAKNSTDAAGSGDDLRADSGSFTLKGAPKARLGSIRCVVE